MKRRFRLTGSAGFKRVRHSGKAFTHPLVVLVALPNELAQTRLTVAASRAVGNAVLRNRAKRLLRAALIPVLEDLKTGWDLILIARRSMAMATFKDTQAAVRNVLERARLLQNFHGD